MRGMCINCLARVALPNWNGTCKNCTSIGSYPLPSSTGFNKKDCQCGEDWNDQGLNQWKDWNYQYLNHSWASLHTSTFLRLCWQRYNSETTLVPIMCSQMAERCYLLPCSARPRLAECKKPRISRQIFCVVLHSPPLYTTTSRLCSLWLSQKQQQQKQKQHNLSRAAPKH